jgi:hypothetical protein
MALLTFARAKVCPLLRVGVFPGRKIRSGKLLPNSNLRRLYVIDSDHAGVWHATCLHCARMNSCEASARPELRDRWVHFRIRDAHIPEPSTLLAEMYGEHLLQGRVREISVLRDKPFVVVDVQGISRPVIIALDLILGVV